ncbi:squalene monooxygenase [Auriscalpium vulgare]|uniref:Squalene monooxygenase n=1 Tax=Auriscalpium vulgare TaxID=40419 RepID=A0ACB8RTU6_9AGAM|nr:squalene monooxygenase [Auriscalpium vulgare]
MWSKSYDVVIVGAGVAGSALAHALSSFSSTRPSPLRIALLERSLAEPDRIVGELLQPGGVAALRALGMESCLDDIDAVPVHGYCVVEGGANVHIPYPEGHEGRSFHHGRFIQRLRAKARAAPGVDVIEATVSELIECQFTGRVLGVQATRKDADGEKETFYADLVVIADGCFSNFRSTVMGAAAAKADVRGHFVGAILEDAVLPIPQHGTVALVKGFGPVLLYQIAEHDTRILIDVKNPLPSDLKKHILSNILPQLPSALHLPIENALAKERLRRMPNSFLPPVEQGNRHTKEGAILLGDAWNMRHPLTGGGMTVAFNDTLLLARELVTVGDLGDWSAVSRVLHHWHWARKPLAATINVLSIALYDLFGADDEYLAALRTGCFKYFERGGECVNGPVSLLSGITPDPVLLFNHFFAVAFYSLWIMFTHPRDVWLPNADKPIRAVPRFDEYPGLVIKSFRVVSCVSTSPHPNANAGLEFWTAVIVFAPLLWSELKWW